MLARHTIASLTALSVLMCSVLCACPSFAEAYPQVTDKVTVRHSYDDHSTSHDHQQPKKTSGQCHGEAAAPEPEDAPAQPCEDHGGKSCSHCEQPLISSTDDKPVEFTPHHYFFVTFFLPLFEGTVQPQVTASKPPALAGAPPPAEWTTLLRLHCALIN